MHAIPFGTMLLMIAGSPILQAGADVVLLGHTAKIVSPWFACRTKEDVQFLKEASSQRTMSTARHFAAARGCIVLHAGTTGIVDDASVWSANSCIRIPGKKHCYWFPDRFIRNKAQNH